MATVSASGSKLLSMTPSLSTTAVDAVSLLDLSKRNVWDLRTDLLWSDISLRNDSGTPQFRLQSSAARFPRFKKPDVRPMLHDNKQKCNSRAVGNPIQPSGHYT
jgi:hypothetical protein